MSKFQSTRLRGARHPPFYICERRSFNPRAREGRDAISLFNCVVQFQSTRPRGARRDEEHRRDQDVSILAPARGATPNRFGSLADCFNPRAREGRDEVHLQEGAQGVSIHAPARGATRSATASRPPCFNPRAREGRDLENVRQRRERVSIHAPARGATRRLVSSYGLFQSTRPRGARRARLPRRTATCFNPRAREGRDGVHQGVPAHVVSIHAPARGATSWCCWASSPRFNPRAREGRDQV